MMKKLMATALSLAVLSTTGVSSMAATPKSDTTQGATTEIAAQWELYHISVNGVSMPLSGEAKVTADKKTCIMVPLRCIAEALDFTVTWSEGVAHVEGHDVSTNVVIGKDVYFITTSIADADGMSAPFSLGIAPYVKEGSTYAPIEIFETLLGNNVDTVTIEGNRIAIQSDTQMSCLPNPLTDYQTLNEAERMVGFTFTVPEKIEGYDTWDIQTVGDDMIQLYYRNADKWLLLRKSNGTQDNSSDYNDYSENTQVTIEDSKVSLRGEKGVVHVATWTDGEHAFSVNVSTGMSADAMLALIGQIQ